jgi:hypothetical protein
VLKGFNVRFASAGIFLISIAAAGFGAESNSYCGRYFEGKGDIEYLKLLDISRRMFDVDEQYENISMLYTPKWNGFVEGPTWKSWWVQNSYGTTYCGLPFYREPYVSFLQNANDNWWKFQGDGRTEYSYKNLKWTPPDGHMMDCASDEKPISKQGDGNAAIHDWPIEFTEAVIVMQAEALLISRDAGQIKKYLPKLERAANFVETRRDPNNGLLLSGPASNLLAPSFGGYKRPDGTFGMAYNAGVAITYIAALDRLIEVEKLAGRIEKANLYSERRERTRKALVQLVTDEGYFIRSIDPDGVKHGVYGAAKYGAFETSPNHDAICFRVVDDEQAVKIYNKIVAIPLRPNDLIICNYPSYDDTYIEDPNQVWTFGHWVNGGHWSTCEARMIMGYYRLGRYEDARRSMKALMKFADEFKMDNPLTNFGAAVYQRKKPINLTYDAFGIPAAMIRGLFEYAYSAEGVRLYPHVPEGITEFGQKFPIRLGDKELYIWAAGSGKVRAVSVNGETWKDFDANSVMLEYGKLRKRNVIKIAMGGGKLESLNGEVKDYQKELPGAEDEFWKFGWVSKALAEANSTAGLEASARKSKAIYDGLAGEGRQESVKFKHARVALEAAAAVYERQKMIAEGKIRPLSKHRAEVEARRLYIDTAVKLAERL